MTGGCFGSSSSGSGSTSDGPDNRAPWHVQRRRIYMTLAAPVSTQPKQQQQQQQCAPAAGMYALSVYDTAAVTQVYVSLHQQDEARVGSESYVPLQLTVLRVGTGFTHEVVAQEGPTTARQTQCSLRAQLVCTSLTVIAPMLRVLPSVASNSAPVACIAQHYQNILPSRKLITVGVVLSPGRYIIVPTATTTAAATTDTSTNTEDAYTDSPNSNSSPTTSSSDSDAPLPLLSPGSSAFTAAARAAISSIFDRLDADGDGVLSSKELSGFLRATEGVSLPAEALQFVQQHFDCREGGLTRLGLLQAYRFIWKDGGGEAAVRRDLQYFGYNSRFELSYPCRTATLVVHADNAIDLAGCKYDVSAASAAAATAQHETAQE
eukprot:17973-Heterococcus_DN1.PRE.2